MTELDFLLSAGQTSHSVLVLVDQVLNSGLIHFADVL